jgi:hypothetical protein
MLVNIPAKCYGNLMPPIQRNQQDPAKEFEYEGRNMKAMAKLLDFLDHNLNLTEEVSNIFYNSNS